MISIEVGSTSMHSTCSSCDKFVERPADLTIVGIGDDHMRAVTRLCEECEVELWRKVTEDLRARGHRKDVQRQQEREAKRAKS